MKMLVQSSKQHSVAILSVTAPLIVYACDTQHSSSGGGFAVEQALSAGVTCPFRPPSNVRNKRDASSNGYLVQDGVALWLAVVRNLTEAQFNQHRTELQAVFCTAMTGLGFGPAATKAMSGWNLLSDPNAVAILKDLLLVIEAYALLGGELNNVLLQESSCQQMVVQLYCHILGAVDASLAAYLMRPLQALVLSCPTLAGPFLNESGLLPQLLRGCYASVGCGHMRGIYQAHLQSDAILVAYCTLVAQLLLFNPTALLSALTTIKDEVLMYVQRATGHADEKMLTEGILLVELANLMFRLFDSLAHGTAPSLQAKLWCLSLLTLYPPTMVNNKSVIPPGMTNASCKGSALSQKPDCIMGRVVLMLMQSLPFAMGRAKLEQYQREHCRDRAESVDYFSLCFWCPSTLSPQQLYTWVEPMVKVCKGALVQERSRRAAQCTKRDLAAQIAIDGHGDGALETGDDDDSDDEDGESYEASMKASSSEHDDTTLTAAAAVGTPTAGPITAATGDAQVLDTAVEPIVEVHKLRMMQSGLLTASIEAHLTEKLSQLCRTLGEEQFSTLRCIADLGL
jgi:hypothetical protein